MVKNYIGFLESEIFTRSPIATVLVNLNDKVLDLNEAFEKMFQHKKIDIIDKHLNDVIVPQEYLDQAISFSKVLEKGHYLIEETKRKRKDGVLLDVSLAAYKIELNNKENLIVVSYFAIKDKIELKTNLEKKEKERLLIDKRFSTLTESSVIGVGIISENDTYIFVNHTLANMLGYQKEELIGKSLAFIVPPEEAKNFAEFKEMHRDAKNFVAQATLLKKNGQKIFAYVSESVLLDIGEKIKERIGIIIDITAVKEAEEKIKRERDKAQNYLDIAGVIILTLDIEGKITLINAKGCSVLEYDQDELIGKNWIDVAIQKNQRKAIKQIFDEIVGSSEKVERKIESEVITKSGNIRTLSWNNYPLRDDSGRIIGVISSGEDITERKEAEQALRDSEEKFRTISSSAKDAIIIVNDDGQINYWNQSAEKIFGYLRSEVMREKVHSLLAPDRPMNFAEKEFLQFQRTGKSSVIGRTLELRVKRKDGIYIPVELSLSAVNIKGKWNAIGIARDISERKKAEMQIREGHDKALEASKFKSQFLANMSHEIRTPMNAIIGMTELALLTELNAEQREYLEMVKTSADSLLSLLNDILDFSKIEAGKLEIEFMPFSLQETIGSTLPSLAIRAHQKGLEIAYNIDAKVPKRLLGDPLRIQQIITNLIGNAIKFTETGEVVLNVLPLQKNDNEITLLFSVSDTGIGIPDDKRSKIFELFSQADGSMTRKYGGTGLGLAISSNLVKLMGGEIWVDSVFGKGSTFYFTVKFKVLREQSIQPSDTLSKQLSNKTVLIVDDNATNRRILKDIIKHWEMIPIEAESGNEAIDILNNMVKKETYPDYILMDSNMPGMDGFSTVEKIRQIENGKAVKIMMISSGNNIAEIHRCEELGILAHIFKPVNPYKLRQLMIDIIHDKKPSEEKSFEKTRETDKGLYLNVLLAEDNPVNQKLTVKILEKKSCKVSVAGNGEEALNAYKNNKFDIVLMDVQMPVMDGLIATAKIREMEKATGTRTPIVAMTAHALKGDRERFLAVGMDGYVAKPIKIADLDKEIYRVMKLSEQTKDEKPGEVTEDRTSFKDVLMQKFGQDIEMLKETIIIFLEESPDQIIAIKNAIIRKDVEKLQFNAHKIKGSIGVFDETDIYYDALKLEELGKEGKIEEADKIILSFEDKYIALREELKKIVSEFK